MLVVYLTLLAGIGSAPAQQKVIKIGALYPLTGNLAATGLDCKRGVDLAVEIINGKYDLNLPLAKQEGIPNLDHAKIEVVYADTKGDPKNGLAEAERLITEEKVVALIGVYQSAVTKTASQAAERLKVPFVCSDSFSPTLTERGFQYFFRVSPHDGTTARSGSGFVTALVLPRGNAADSPHFCSDGQGADHQPRVIPLLASFDDGYSSQQGRVEVLRLRVKVVSISGAKGKKITYKLSSA
jgi:ABC-type branched-subunit amino acid transport system substrate-binding protein